MFLFGSANENKIIDRNGLKGAVYKHKNGYINPILRTAVFCAHCGYHIQNRATENRQWRWAWLSTKKHAPFVIFSILIFITDNSDQLSREIQANFEEANDLVSFIAPFNNHFRFFPIFLIHQYSIKHCILCTYLCGTTTNKFPVLAKNKFSENKEVICV